MSKGTTIVSVEKVDKEFFKKNLFKQEKSCDKEAEEYLKTLIDTEEKSLNDQLKQSSNNHLEEKSCDNCKHEYDYTEDWDNTYCSDCKDESHWEPRDD